jgi:hypothetical protein
MRRPGESYQQQTNQEGANRAGAAGEVTRFAGILALLAVIGIFFFANNHLSPL